MDASILGQIALSYSPIIDRERNVMATRLTVAPLNPGQRLAVDELLETVSGVWPADGSRVSLSVRSESLLADLLAVQPTANVIIEIPKFMASDPVHRDDILKLAANGNMLLLSGRPDLPLPREVLPAFRYSIIDLADDRRLHENGLPAGVQRSIGFFQDGVHSLADMEGAFRRGAIAVLGWPMDDVVQGKASRTGSATRPDLQVTIELINLVDDEAPLPQIEAALKRDPTLAYKLMRYINSPLFGLRVEISSFTHAVMMLGYQRLKRWLALLLVTAGNDVNLRPVMFAAVRRGLLMEALAEGTADETMRSEMFICGVFSLLDRIFQQPFAELLKTIPVPEQVVRALAHGDGPYMGSLELVRAIEGGTMHDIREHAEQSMLDMRTVNRALLKSLSGALQLS
ncbi:EAL and modified HD-GYP domain-containing signal transduction protein [Sphaerotilus hippei]|uniref:EAL and modified HD-GYP domain-containing signal transduction protein n=1 Tax=Sphaerotilus hippei TaxID=744406 RepID=A0A318GX53_9BURK|nr:HDOD domain-containing protein [Sphaerotilus hippei]PXW93712.1 EAL and modified HD-GYP domain-containing signal transduction protein [Sphaerotilus hippei]